MKNICFPTWVYILVKILETNLYTCALIDTGSEITIFKKFLIKNWNKTNIIIKWVTGTKEKIENYIEDSEVLIGNKIVKIKKVFQYEKIECEIILGSDFIQQFMIYQQTIYNTTLKTPCNKWIKIPRINKPFKIKYNNETRKWNTERINTSITYIVTIKKIQENLIDNFDENPLKYWEMTKIYCN